MDMNSFSDEVFAAYLAAFTDGEGHIGFERPDRKKRHQFYIRITLANCVESVLRDMQQRLGYGAIRSQKQRENWRERFVFVVSNLADCERFLLLVRPYLQIKQAEADIALERIEQSKDKYRVRHERDLAVIAAAQAGERRKDIAARFGISPQLVSRICDGHKWPTNRRQYANSKQRNQLGQFTNLFTLHGVEPPSPEEFSDPAKN